MNAEKDIQTIGIAYNLRKKLGEDDGEEEYDSIETIDYLVLELEKYGFNVIRLEQDTSFCKNIITKKPDFVINLAEGIGSTRGRESQVPCLLESLGIPYSGSDPIALGITLDKYLTNRLLNDAGVLVPDIHLITCDEDLSALDNIFTKQKRYILKPRWEGSSKGIFSDSMISSYEQLCGKVMDIIERYSQPAVLEEFISGAEITAGVIGNNKTACAIGMMKITPAGGDDKDFVYSLEKKRTWRETIKYHPESSIGGALKVDIRNISVKAFNALELRDVARIDFRVGEDNIPRVIDINPLPGLSPEYSDLPILSKLNGGFYSALINDILTASFSRNNFNAEKLTQCTFNT